MSFSRGQILALTAICLGLRLPWAWWGAGAAYDLHSYALVAGLPLRELYSSPDTLGHYPYLPLWAVVLKAMARLQAWLGASPDFWFRLPGIAGDLAIALILPALARAQGASAKASFQLGLAWCLHPLAWLISGAHGQFDSLPLACLLLAYGWLSFGPSLRREMIAALCLGLGIALKTWPLAFLPLFALALPSGRPWRFTAWALLLPLASLAPWWAQPWASRLAYTGVGVLGFSGGLRAGAFGLGWTPELYRSMASLWQGVALALLGLTLLGTALACRRLGQGLWLSALALVIFAPGLSPQSLLWFLPLSLLFGQAAGLSLSAALLLALFYRSFLPEVLVSSGAAPLMNAGQHLAWALVNFLWWAYALWHLWRGLRAMILETNTHASS